MKGMSEGTMADINPREIVISGGVAIIESGAASEAKNNFMWGIGGATLSQKHIDALLAGYTLTFSVEEFQVFISFEDKETP